MSWVKRFQWAGAAVALGMMTALCAGCGAQSAKEELLLYLAFDETEGNEASDSAGKVETAEVQYQYTHATYTDAMDPEAEANGTEQLTAIVSQYDKNKKQGILLGYERYGKLCFQVGTGEDWLTLWGEEAKLEKFGCSADRSRNLQYVLRADG
jgi:hypothetical protein